MQALYTIQEIAVLLIQVSVFLIALLVVWVLILAGAELFRDRMNARIEENRKEMEILKEKMQEEEARKKKLDKEAAAYDMALRNLTIDYKHIKPYDNFFGN